MDSPTIRVEGTEVTVDGKKIDMDVFLAMVNPNARILWRFIDKDGVIQAVPYTEEQVIWIDKGN